MNFIALTAVVLAQILAQNLYADIATGAKLQLPFPPEVGTALPRPGPCPPRTQVIDFFDLCCNDDLLTSDPALAALGLAWLDGDNVNLMHPAGGGGPPAADGDNVVQIDDALGGIIPIALETVPATNTGPTLVVDSVNGRSVLDFNGTTDRLRLDTGAAAGGDFTFFALMSTTDAVTANAAIISVGANNADGDNYAFDQGSWQVSRGNLDDAFVFRFKTDFATEAAAAPVYTTKLFNAPNEGHSGPGPLTSSYDVGVIEWAAFNDGALHSIAVSFEAATSILKIWFDGELRVEGDFGAFAVSMAALGNDFFRFFGNDKCCTFYAGNDSA